ncbi:MAG: ribosome hibernation-promoting factor, HPF/YfiA family [Candidatus Nanopelagicaceae bacterium]
MEIVIHARNANLAEDFRGIVTEKLKSLDRFSVKVESIKVEIKHEQNPRFGKSSHEVVLTTTGAGPFMRSEGAGFNDLAAFDKAATALELQMRKIHEKSKEINHESLRKPK